MDVFVLGSVTQANKSFITIYGLGSCIFDQTKTSIDQKYLNICKVLSFFILKYVKLQITNRKWFHCNQSLHLMSSAFKTRPSQTQCLQLKMFTNKQEYVLTNILWIEVQNKALYFQSEWLLFYRMGQAMMTVLLMPELLERIFARLSRKDMKAVVLVCKWG